MTVKTFTQEEYQRLQEEDQNEMVSKLGLIMMTHQIVAVEIGEDMFKILKYPKLQSMINESQDEKLGIIVSRHELEQFIFLLEI